MITFWPLVLIAAGVSADAFAVALGRGLQLTRFSARTALIYAVTFGLFQALMPVLGWLLGSTFARYIAAYDHWVAFALLTALGAKMLHEAFASHESNDRKDDRIDVRRLLTLALATSIDALAVGISFAFLEVSLFWAVLLIGAFTLVVTFLGIVLGHRIGARWGKPAEIVGGLLLIAIGVRILFDHLGIW